MRSAPVFALCLLLFACGPNEPEPITFLAPPAAGEGFQLAMDTRAAPGSEIWKCAVYPIPIDSLAAVNHVRYQQNPGMHHMTISTPSLSGRQIAHGMYDCADLDVMEGITMIFGAQGDAEGELRLPTGIAASLPAEIDILHELHYVNTSNEPVDVYSRLNAYTIPSSEVVGGVWGGQVRDETIVLPPKVEHSEWTRCTMNEDVDVLFLASHTHQLGVDFTVSRFDGHTVGEQIYENTDLHTPKIQQFDPPLKLQAGEGFEYKCTWKNRNDHEVVYGLRAEDEMCNLTIVHTPLSYSAECKVVATSDGVLWSKD